MGYIELNIPNLGGRATRGRGFTLLEVLLAVTIFAITLSALLVTFRVGIRAWRAGHVASEMYQTARIAEDVITRDLRNVAFMTEMDYNKTFREQIEELTLMRQVEDLDLGDELSDYMPRRRRSRAEGDQRESDDDEDEEDHEAYYLNVEDIAQPLDLSFSGEDGELLDHINFARFHRPRSRDDINPQGYVRVSYYVIDGILYREENSAVGYRPGDEMQTYYETASDEGDVAKLFISPKSNKGLDDDGEEAAQNLFQIKDEDEGSALAETEAIAEPLCEGVEIFDITYGYYRFGQWVEVTDWDSNDFGHRFPRGDRGAMPGGRGALANLLGMGGGGGDAIPVYETFGYRPDRSRPPTYVGQVNGRAIPFKRKPDNLPGYVAVQLGIRDKSGDGRLRSFTFFVSLPMASEEIDTSTFDETNRSGFVAPTGGAAPGGSNSLYNRGGG